MSVRFNCLIPYYSTTLTRVTYPYPYPNPNSNPNPNPNPNNPIITDTLKMCSQFLCSLLFLLVLYPSCLVSKKSLFFCDGNQTLDKNERPSGRRFFDTNESEQQTPAVLYTVPCVGNTWMRMMIEWATGIYSGSQPKDAAISQITVGEHTCANGKTYHIIALFSSTST